MSDNDSQSQKTVNVTVAYTNDGSGNSGGGRFEVTCVDWSITVNKKNTEIIYQLTSDTPKDIIFTGFSAIPGNQLGAAVVSNSGRKMTTNDALSNTTPEKIAVTLQFAEVFSFDPEVNNTPQTM
jgi:hypothetical protein